MDKLSQLAKRLGVELTVTVFRDGRVRIGFEDPLLRISSGRGIGEAVYPKPCLGETFEAAYAEFIGMIRNRILYWPGHNLGEDHAAVVPNDIT